MERELRIFVVSIPISFTSLELKKQDRQSCRQRNPPAQKLPVFHPDTHIHPHYPWSHRFLPGGVAGVFGQFRISNGWCRYLLSGSWQTCPAGFPAEWLWLAAPDGSRAVYPGNRYAAARLFQCSDNRLQIIWTAGKSVKLVCGELAGDGSQREKPVRHRVWLWEFPK